MTGPEELLAANRASVLAPAGCGKTELIASAVVAEPDRRHLVLTHTHAGVSALRSRLTRMGAPTRSFRVDTIAGFALRFATAYPATSGYDIAHPIGNDWHGVYAAATVVFRREVGREILRHSFSGVFVDEYQDCTEDQHALVETLADVLPCRVVGDPLQGIFGFRDQRLIEWETVLAAFPPLEPLATPWRWLSTNPDLGEWLLRVRPTLISNAPLDLRGAPIDISDGAEAAQVKALYSAARAGGTVVGIRQFPDAAHEIAKKLGGRFTSMEEMDCKDLQNFARKFDASSGADLAAHVVDFATRCMTEVSTVLANARGKLRQGAVPAVRAGTKPAEAVAALAFVAADGSASSIHSALRQISRIPGARVFRRELLSEMGKTLRCVAAGEHESLAEAAWTVRDRARHVDRRLDKHMISRTLLVKGLEFDRCLVLNANELDNKNLYVALTRGSTSLGVHVSGNRHELRYKGSKRTTS